MKFVCVGLKCLYVSVLLMMFTLVLDAQISKSDLLLHVKKLSSVEFEGRGLNSNGLRCAEAYILTEMNKLNLKMLGDSYRQEFAVKARQSVEPSSALLVVNDDTLRFGQDYVSLNQNDSQLMRLPLYVYKVGQEVFADKSCALMLDNIEDVDRVLQDNVEVVLVNLGDDFNDIADVNINGKLNDSDWDKYFKLFDKKIKVYYVGSYIYKHILTQIQDKPTYINAIVKRKKSCVNPCNIIAYLPGEIGDSTVVISAHYDHLGVVNDVLYPGANDNASGTAVVIEIAKALNAYSNKIKRPKYNVLFAFFSAEESGLLGSKYFVKYSGYDLSKTIANVNIDMIASRDAAHKDVSNFVYAYGPEETSASLMYKTDSINRLNKYLYIDFFSEESERGKRFCDYQIRQVLYGKIFLFCSFLTALVLIIISLKILTKS